jgi:hypothetical protein
MPHRWWIACGGDPDLCCPECGTPGMVSLDSDRNVKSFSCPAAHCWRSGPMNVALVCHLEDIEFALGEGT